MLVLDNGNCFLYELYNSSVNSDGSWNADSTAVWDLLSDEQRPYTWTSADAAGLPVFPGLVRYDEVASAAIHHAFRFTLPHTERHSFPPASHWAGNTSDPTAPPMGMRLRLKSSYDISGFYVADAGHSYRDEALWPDPRRQRQFALRDGSLRQPLGIGSRFPQDRARLSV